MKLTFYGYYREHGPAGVRNYTAIIPTIGCANEVALRIADSVENAYPILHHQGCCQLSPDLEVINRVLTGIGKNPNVHSVLLVSLGCESIDPENIKEKIGPDKPAKVVSLQKLGGITATVDQGISIANKMASNKEDERDKAPLSDLTIGVKCGASDATSGIASNPATGAAVDRLIEEGATVIFGETTEVLGAEHILAKRALNQHIEDQIFEAVEDMESRAKAFGVDMRGGQPTGGNIKGGLTTIEDKSLGAISKSGTKPIQGILEYGERPSTPGLFFMDSPGREMEFLTGVAAAGCQIILFSTGLGAPQGFPTVPVIKISGNKNTCQHLKEHLDVGVSPIIEGKEGIDEAGERIFKEVIQVASGKKVKAELLGYDKHGVNSNIYTKGPVI